MGTSLSKYLLFLGKAALASLCAYAFYILAVEYHPDDPLGYRPPYLLFVLDTINLFIHEGGHLLCRMFGETMYVLGGSLVQCLLPFMLIVGTWRERPHQVGYPLFWFGQNLVNVSVYIADAPHKNLKLLAGGVIHDWNWLLADNLEIAEPLGLVVRGVGLVVCAAAVVTLGYYTLKTLREDASYLIFDISRKDVKSQGV